VAKNQFEISPMTTSAQIDFGGNYRDAWEKYKRLRFLSFLLWLGGVLRNCLLAEFCKPAHRAIRIRNAGRPLGVGVDVFWDKSSDLELSAMRGSILGDLVVQQERLCH
jgi:hypothetical protein